MTASGAAPDVADRRLLEVLDALQRLALLDFSRPAPVTGTGDLADALAAGVNMLGEEVQALRSDFETRVADRTRQLRESNERLESEAAERRRAEQQLHRRNDELKQWIDELERLHREISELTEMSNLLQACRTRDEAFVALAHASRRLFPDTSGCIYVYPPSRDHMAAVTRWGATEPIVPVLDVAECWGLRRGRLHAAGRAHDGLRCAHTPEGVAAHCMPLTAAGDILGLLHLRSADADDSADADSGAAKRRRRLIEAAAEQIALSLANLELRTALESQSIRDALTGLFNRRYFEASLPRELRRAERAGSQVAVMVVDVDRFKEFNDRYGHTVGDLALREIAGCLAARARDDDIVCRYGGEEFAVVMADVDRRTAIERAESLAAAVRGLVVTWRGQVLRSVTVSIGVAVHPDHGASVRTLFDAADAAMYRAKRGGRDRVEVATDDARTGSRTPHWPDAVEKRSDGPAPASEELDADLLAPGAHGVA